MVLVVVLLHKSMSNIKPTLVNMDIAIFFLYLTIKNGKICSIGSIPVK